MDWEFVVAGLFTGLLVGMTGMGGGSLMTPILVFLFGIPPSTAIGTDIAHGAAFKTVSAVQHRRMGNVRARLAGWMLIGSAPASLLGVWLNVQLTERYGDDVESVMGQVLGAAPAAFGKAVISSDKADGFIELKGIDPPRERNVTQLQNSIRKGSADALLRGPDPERDGVSAWRLVDICAHAEEAYGVRYSGWGMSRLLRRLGLSRQTTRPRHPEGRAAERAAFKKWAWTDAGYARPNASGGAAAALVRG